MERGQLVSRVDQTWTGVLPQNLTTMEFLWLLSSSLQCASLTAEPRVTTGVSTGSWQQMASQLCCHCIDNCITKNRCCGINTWLLTVIYNAQDINKNVSLWEIRDNRFKNWSQMHKSRSVKTGKSSLVVCERLAASGLFCPDDHASPHGVIVQLVVRDERVG